MKKLFILLVFVSLIGGVYYTFMAFKDKTEKEMNEPKKSTKMKNSPSRAIDTIDSSYYSVCLQYVNSVDYQITLNQITNSETPSVITDPNYTSTRYQPDQVNLVVNDRGIVESGTVTYEHVICNYENGRVNLEKRTN